MDAGDVPCTSLPLALTAPSPALRLLALSDCLLHQAEMLRHAEYLLLNNKTGPAGASRQDMYSLPWTDLHACCQLMTRQGAALPTGLLGD